MRRYIAFVYSTIYIKQKANISPWVIVKHSIYFHIWKHILFAMQIYVLGMDEWTICYMHSRSANAYGAIDLSQDMRCIAQLCYVIKLKNYRQFSTKLLLQLYTDLILNIELSFNKRKINSEIEEKSNCGRERESIDKLPWGFWVVIELFFC